MVDLIHIVFTIFLGNFTATSSDSLKGDANDISAGQPNSLATETPLCHFVRYFDGDQVGLDHARIDGFFIGATPSMGTATVSVDSEESEFVAAEAQEETMHPETTEADEEVDAYDLTTEEENTLQQIFLPVVVQP